MRCKNPLTDVKAEITIGCGKCLYCRIQRRREWTIRMMHECTEHREACFITLTYAEDPVSISKLHAKLFLRRLRRYAKANKIVYKYYLVGEYGERYGRPHYHAIIFGHYFNRNDLEAIWKRGLVDIATVTPDSIRYVAGYIEKKLSGPRASEYNGKQVPFSLMSKKIGGNYFLKNIDRILADGYVVYKNKRQGIPRYYLKILKKMIGDEAYGYYRDRYRECNEPRRLYRDVEQFGGDPLSAQDWREAAHYNNIRRTRALQCERSIIGRLNIKKLERNL